MLDKAPVRYYDKDHGYLLTASQALKNARYRIIPDFKGGYIVTELMVCDRPKFNADGYGLLGEKPCSFPAADDDADSDPAAVIDRSRRRARRAVRDIMDCNQFKYFMTFTLNGERFNRGDYPAFVKLVNKYLGNRVARYGWFYVAVPEYHKDGKNLHLHAVVGGDRFNLVNSGTVLRPDGGRPVKLDTALRQGYKREDLKTVYNVSDWVDGYSTAIEVYGGRLALTRYILKYITKSDDKIGGRWYFSGGKLDRPIYVYKNLPYLDIEDADVEFKNDGGEFKIKYIDKELPVEGLQALL